MSEGTKSFLHGFVCLDGENAFLCTFIVQKSLIIKAFFEFSASECMHLCLCVCGPACEFVWVTPGPRLELWSHSRGPMSATHCTDLGTPHLCACGVCGDSAVGLMV